MINKLTLENFEGHKKTKFDFHPGLNVFVGESDRGKSSVFRAFKLLTQNKPGGEWMRPLYWDGTTVITGDFVNDDKSAFTLKRTRGKSDNTYQLNDNDPVNAGTSVPADIAELLDMDSVNIQTQIERAFLMFESAGERGRILNKIAGLDEIDTTLDNAKKDWGKLKKSWETEKAIAKSEKEKLEELPDIEAMELAVDAIDFKGITLGLSNSRVIGLRDSVDKLKTVEDSLRQGEKLLEAQSALEALTVQISAIAEAGNRINKLKNISIGLHLVEKYIKKDNYDKAEERLELLTAKNNELLALDKKLDNLDQILGRLDIIEQDVKTGEEELKTLQAEIPNICTECGNKL